LNSKSFVSDIETLKGEGSLSALAGIVEYGIAILKLRDARRRPEEGIEENVERSVLTPGICQLLMQAGGTRTWGSAYPAATALGH
jgi:hypothetical protein